VRVRIARGSCTSLCYRVYLTTSPGSASRTCPLLFFLACATNGGSLCTPLHSPPQPNLFTPSSPTLILPTLPSLLPHMILSLPGGTRFRLHHCRRLSSSSTPVSSHAFSPCKQSPRPPTSSFSQPPLLLSNQHSTPLSFSNLLRPAGRWDPPFPSHPAGGVLRAP
jgi:hypothetical protein